MYTGIAWPEPRDVDGGNTRVVTVGLFVSPFGIAFFCRLYLVIVIQIISFVSLELACLFQSLHPHPQLFIYQIRKPGL